MYGTSFFTVTLFSRKFSFQTYPGLYLLCDRLESLADSPHASMVLLHVALSQLLCFSPTSEKNKLGELLFYLEFRRNFVEK
jgi:hypothetical protein